MKREKRGEERRGEKRREEKRREKRREEKRREEKRRDEKIKPRCEALWSVSSEKEQQSSLLSIASVWRAPHLHREDGRPEVALSESLTGPPAPTMDTGNGSKSREV